MLSHKKSVLAVLLAGWSSGLLAATPDFREGEWGTSYRMEVIGAPFPMPPITARKSACLSQKNFVPDNSQQNQNCKVSDIRVNGNTVSWKLSCHSGDGLIEGQGKVTYQDEKYDGVMDARMVAADGSGGPIRYRYTMHGERLGACSK